MQRFLVNSFFLALLLASCAPQPVRVAEPTSISSPVVLAHAPEIRFALIGNPKDVNVWELFDESGATYVDYALRAEYWPRLYHLALPSRTLEPLAANGMPSDVIQEGDFYVATVKLRTDLKWTDGSAFTADDVAFTLNTALVFELSYDWSLYSGRKYLDHVEALDPATVKYYFKQKPNAEIWQYGVLQSPIVQKAFWAPSAESAAKLLPADQLRTDLDKANAYVATVQSDVTRLQNENPIAEPGSDLKRMQDELIFAQNNLNKLVDEYSIQIQAAHKALYNADDKGEPTLGIWMPAGEVNGAWVNKVNPDFPFIKPNFDRAVYHVFKDEEAAIQAFQNKEVDFILSAKDLTQQLKGEKYNSSYSARFLVFNPLRTQLADIAFHAALSCMIDRDTLAKDTLQNHAAPLDSFLLSQWHDPNIKDACVGMDKSARIEQAVKLLKDAGYSWTQEPSAESSGQNLLLSNGEAFPKVTLAAPSKVEDPLRYAAAKYIAGQAQYLGISFAVQEMSINDVVYAVYSSQKYDIALMGWRLSEYPAYLCQMFGGQNLHLYNSDRFKSSCDALQGQSNLDAARQSFSQIEATLMSELPFLPLFTVVRADVYQGLSYPAAGILNGWSGLYGAPSVALPLP